MDEGIEAINADLETKTSQNEELNVQLKVRGAALILSVCMVQDKEGMVLSVCMVQDKEGMIKELNMAIQTTTKELDRLSGSAAGSEGELKSTQQKLQVLLECLRVADQLAMQTLLDALEGLDCELQQKDSVGKVAGIS